MKLLFLLALLVALSNAYKILVYNSKYGHSHSNFMGRIADELADAGHNVTSLIPVMRENMKDGTYKSNQIIYVPAGEKTKKVAESMMAGGGMPYFEETFFSLKSAFVTGPAIGRMFSTQCEVTINHPGLIEKLRAEKYDVFLSESFDMCGIGMSGAIKPKSMIAVGAGTLFGFQYDEIGVPTMPSFNPSSYTTHLDPHSIVSRGWNLIGDWLFRRFFIHSRTEVEDVLRERFGQDYPSLQELTSRTAYYFSNAEPLIDFAHPTLHKVIDIGGIGVKPAGKVSKEWEEILGRREKNVLFSFGSVAKSALLKPDMKRAILKTFQSMPEVTFIWKYEEPEDEFAIEAKKTTPNLVMSSWTPQSDLLNHPRLSAFVSHGGMGSVTETASRGVPGLFVPLFGDQPRNAGMMEHNKAGKVFDKFDLDKSEILTAAIRDVLENPTYRTNAKRIAAMIQNKPFGAREQLLKYVAFAAEFGPSPSLRPQSQDMTLIEYFNLDIIFVATALVLLFAIVTLKIVSMLFRKFVRASKEEKVKRN